MSAVAWRVVGLGLALALLLTAGAGIGAWLAADYYRPLLDTANSDLSMVKAGRDNLEALTGEQGKKLGELVLASELRERNAALAQGKAREEARPDYAAANRIMQERTGGDPALAAESIIDQELGL